MRVVNGRERGLVQGHPHRQPDDGPRHQVSSQRMQRAKRTAAHDRGCVFDGERTLDRL